jgi:catechol 2,3-dioxygenase-like lactoylglutathione lyase family enzyme
MSSTPKFAHVVFQTGQLPQMRDWYCRVLDAHVVDEDKTL